jgi:hypothetical protein
MCKSRFSETLISGFRIPFRNFQCPHFVVQGDARLMPVRLSGAPLIERYGAPTIAQPHGPLAVKDYNPTHGIKFAPRLSPGIMGSPPITMTSKEVRAVCSASCCSVHRFACLSHRCAFLTDVHLSHGCASLSPRILRRRVRSRSGRTEATRQARTRRKATFARARGTRMGRCGREN